MKFLTAVRTAVSNVCLYMAHNGNMSTNCTVTAAISSEGNMAMLPESGLRGIRMPCLSSRLPCSPATAVMHCKPQNGFHCMRPANRYGKCRSAACPVMHRAMFWINRRHPCHVPHAAKFACASDAFTIPANTIKKHVLYPKKSGKTAENLVDLSFFSAKFP